jgi:hypothetical protein
VGLVRPTSRPSGLASNGWDRIEHFLHHPRVVRVRR